ncbi:MAG: AAA family ATPase [Lachnospiraceae bacterium]|nr:AAA family ATPase [Lachnospiraceae bacterium]
MPFTPLALQTAEMIYYRPITAPPMLIEGILPSGLTVLSGDSKIGKSWLVLWLCLKSCKGEEVWGIPTRKQDVVYLALEDRESRIQKRMHLLTEDPPQNLYITFTCGKIGAELEDQIRDAIKEHPDTGVIFIDTLQKIREGMGGNANIYAKDYQDISSLKTIADDKGIGIVLVHHTKKERTGDDIFDDTSGSKAVQGASDTSLILRKDDRFGDMATLSITGRDVEDRQLRLKKNGVVWNLVEVLDREAIHREAIPPFLFKIAELVLNEGTYKGTISDLLKTIGETDLAPHVASKQIARFGGEVFSPLDLEVFSQRRATAREYTIRLRLSCDANDADDAKRRREKLASLRGDVIESSSTADGSDASTSLPETASQPSLASLPEPEKDNGFRDITPEDDVPFDI